MVSLITTNGVHSTQHVLHLAVMRLVEPEVLMSWATLYLITIRLVYCVAVASTCVAVPGCRR